MNAKNILGVCWGLVICSLLPQLAWGADEPGRSAVIKADTEFWTPGTSLDDLSSGTFSKGDIVEVKKEFTVNKIAFKFVELKGKTAKSGWVRADKVSINKEPATPAFPSDAASFALPASSAQVNQMGFDVLRKSAASGGNSLISPYGIWANLQILRQGAKGKSLKEIEALIGAPDKGEAQSFPSTEFRSIDCFVHKDDIELTKSFQDFAKATGLEVKSSPFDDSTRVEFNTWVFEQSNKLIPDFFTPTTWNKDAQVLIANVAYFRGEWTHKFNPEMTQDVDFHLSSKETIQTPMMIASQQAPWFTSDALKCDGTILPYLSGDIAAVVIVPREMDGLNSLLEGLNGDSFDKLLGDLPNDLSQVPKQKVTVLLPKVDLASEFNVDEALNLNTLTSDGADLSGIFATKRVKISRIIQKTRVRVDETGTEAAAATTTEAVASSIDLDPPKVVNADHPFLLCITHWPSRSVLFACAIVDPRSAPKKD